jgi:multidrug efflux pump subunit AcrA (membrane-fusion protein)/GAF domain-containing protein
MDRADDATRTGERLHEPEGRRPPLSDAVIEGLYAQVAQNAARLLVVHEASRILRSTHDAAELARGLLDTIAEALFASSGCVASIDGDEMSVLATRGLEEVEVDRLTASGSEATFWFFVAEDGEVRGRDELVQLVDGAGAAEVAAETPAEAELGFVEEDASGAPGREGPAFEIYIPLSVEERVMGVLALGPRVDASPYSAEDREFAVSLGGHLGIALQSAELLSEKARRIEELSVLLRISREITSTLDLDRVLGTIVQMLSLVVPNRRALVALVSAEALSIRASSTTGFDPKATKADPILPVLEWARAAGVPVNASREACESDPEAAGRDVILPYLSADGGPRALAILRLEDDQGVLGLLVVEFDSDAPPLGDDRDELVRILANQATVAIRNAELYQRLPMRGVFAPILGKKRAAGAAASAVPWWRTRNARLAAVAAVALLVPLPCWVAGSATVRPVTPVALRAQTEGTVMEVLVKEGDRVTSGTVVARLRQDELTLRLHSARAAMQSARAEAGRARADGDLATYRARQEEILEFRREEEFLLTELGRTELVSTIDGVVLTPRVELRRGEHLGRGQTLLEVADLSSLDVDVSVPQEEIGALAAGKGARLKVHAFPGRTFRGEVERIGARAESDRTFRVTVRVPNDDGALRPGMTGRAHVPIGPRPLLWSALRPMWRSLRLKLWV